MIPVAADGLKPFTAYAGGTDADRARAARMPSIAIVIGGLGVGAAKTSDAIMKLPPAVTLAFTPYGSDPGKLVERARAQRHEVLLQIPMEPFDYPDNDPGPQTLLTTLAPSKISTACSGTSANSRAMPESPISWARALSSPTLRCSRSFARPPNAGSATSTTGRRRAASPPRWRRARRCRSPGPISASTRCRHRWKSTGRWRNSRASQGARNRGRHRVRTADLDRADRRLDQVAGEPRHHACAIDNRDAEIKIKLTSS